MIASISGIIIVKGSNFLVVEAGGIGYRVFVVNNLIVDTTIGKSIKLLTYMVIREDTQALYGFLTSEEQELFSMLISVSGIGPRVALAILSSGKVVDLKSAIGRGDSTIFTVISGIGQKTAQRVILELRSKVGVIGFGDENSDSEEVINALSGLGYNMYEIRKILSKVPAQASIEEKVKEALKLLG